MNEQSVKMRVLISLLVICLSSSTIAQSDSQEVTNSNHQFTTDWYNVIAKTTTSNIICSPFSAHAALSMAWQGAKGTTDEAFAKTLHLTGNAVAATGYNKILNNLNNVQNITLSIANKLFLKEGKELLPEFENAITTNFASDVEQLDFLKKAESSQTINNWVEQNTNGKIKNLISPNDLDRTTRLILVNAIYFKGNWKYQFDKTRTRKRPFYLNEHDTVDVDMMHIEEHFNYKANKELDAKILEMPYQNKDFSLVIILPNEKNGIKALEEKLKNVPMREITEGLFHLKVVVALPKFSLSTTIDMKDSLTQLGLGEIFDDKKANFTGMIPDEELYVSKSVQKAFIQVDEEGAEAGAASAIVMSIPYSLHSGPKYFIADHPFIFMIKGQDHPLFIGKLAEF